MKRLSKDYKENVQYLDCLFRVQENFDIIKKPLAVGSDELTLYYIDGFVKDAVMGKLMIYFLLAVQGMKELVHYGLLKVDLMYLYLEMVGNIKLMKNILKDHI